MGLCPSVGVPLVAPEAVWHHLPGWALTLPWRFFVCSGGLRPCCSWRLMKHLWKPHLYTTSVGTYCSFYCQEPHLCTCWTTSICFRHAVCSSDSYFAGAPTGSCHWQLTPVNFDSWERTTWKCRALITKHDIYKSLHFYYVFNIRCDKCTKFHLQILKLLKNAE